MLNTTSRHKLKKSNKNYVQLYISKLIKAEQNVLFMTYFNVCVKRITKVELNEYERQKLERQIPGIVDTRKSTLILTYSRLHKGNPFSSGFPGITETH